MINVAIVEKIRHNLRLLREELTGRFGRRRFGLYGQWIDAKFESLREEHIKKWREKGYSERLIRRALAYANDYSIGIGEALGVSPEVIYPKSLEFADTWLEELTKALFV